MVETITSDCKTNCNCKNEKETLVRLTPSQRINNVSTFLVSPAAVISARYSLNIVPKYWKIQRYL